ncbi:DMT family transporter [Methylotenera sp.]|uniref:DMT family transporter n=1 Tax=Methylotenera sp. TaxID=2051956 RepID=UPI002731F6AA|nr:DMT family transporter [Methylotenera sp.]MDP2072182.1 DMT family transporter [Methylotenera sp.]MDP2231644.1 DMT family transporter [Methylotenera sp.]MDP3006807.1 DMT family transporter [Methylotenera sp.]MDP3007256.1 DMT family transporter [Methylotenera sp.]MDP3141553.1 DMT family transporter [Methylotenera sp.]
MNNANQPQHHASGHYLVVFGLLFGALCWGIIWYPYRIMAEAGVSGAVSSFYTYCIATVIAGIYFAKYWRGIFNLPFSIIWLGIVAGWTNLAYVLAVIDGEVMRVMLLFYLSPLWTLILAHFWLKEKTQLVGYIAIAVSLIGAFIMLYDPQVSSLPLPKNTAEWLALSSGMGFSITNVITRQSTHLSIRAKSFAVWLGVLAVSLVFIIFSNNAISAPSVFSLSNWLVMILIAILLMAATLLVQYGVTRMPATRASVLFLFELVVAAIASYYLAHETMAINEWIGGSLIIAAAIFAAFNHGD